jgi:hypothetical protein
VNHNVVRALAFGSFALAAALAARWQAQANDVPALFTKAAPIDEYMMDRNAEINLARSAAPESISHDAEILVLKPHGYETAVTGKNGFVCMVERSWMAPFDDPEFLNPDQRLPLCLNPAAVRSHLALLFESTRLALAGMPKARMFAILKASYDRKELPMPDAGAMCYMMSKQQYFGAKFKNADPHLMFWFPESEKMTWGAGLQGSPVYVHQDSPDPITTFVISVSEWSDGTAAPAG